MKMPKLVCVQLFIKWRLEPLRQKEKKCWSTNQHCISLMRKKGNCHLPEIPVCPCLVLMAPGFLELRALLCRNGAGCWLLTEVWEMDKFSPVHKTLPRCPWQCLPTRGLPWCQWPQYSCGTFSCDFLHPPATLLTGGCVRANKYILNQAPQHASTPSLKWYYNWE